MKSFTTFTKPEVLKVDFDLWPAYILCNSSENGNSKKIVIKNEKDHTMTA